MLTKEAFNISRYGFLELLLDGAPTTTCGCCEEAAALAKEPTVAVSKPSDPEFLLSENIDLSYKFCLKGF